jgi:hypothetical protein
LVRGYSTNSKTCLIFNCGEFATIKNQASFNRYRISVREWVKKTGVVGLVARTGRVAKR